MTAFLRIDRCLDCQGEKPWEWVPPVLLAGRTLAGTGVWRSTLVESCCSTCRARREASREKERRAFELRGELIRLLGGEKPYQVFTFERFCVRSENRLAFEASRDFDCARQNLYLWGPCGVGKTHLAYAAARHSFEQGRAMMIATPMQLSRQVRMRDPDQEQAAIDRVTNVDVLVLDDVGVGHPTAFVRQVLQEVLDGRDFKGRAGLLVTSACSLDALAELLGEDHIPSRLAGLCSVVEIRGQDHRLESHREAKQI